jgi:hypothetical protein
VGNKAENHIWTEIRALIRIVDNNVKCSNIFLWASLYF